MTAQRSSRAFGPARIARLLRVLPVLVRIGWRLLSDDRVPKRHKAVLVAALGYVVSPIDLSLDAIPLIGRLDDLFVVGAGVAWAMRFAPRHVVDEHLAEIGLTRPELEQLLISLVPAPIELAWRNRHRVAPHLEAAAQAAGRAGGSAWHSVVRRAPSGESR